MDEQTDVRTVRAALAAASQENEALLSPDVRRTTDAVWLPTLTRHLGLVLAGHAAPGSPDAVRTAAAISRLARLAGPEGEGRAATRQALTESYRHVRTAATQVYEVVAAALACPDAPDVGELSKEMLRLEAMRFVADALGDRKATEEFAYISRRVARIALTRAAAAVDAFLAERDLLRLFDNAAVIGRVDDMMTLAQRVLDAKAAHEEEVTAFVEPADQAALSTFLDSLDRLAAALIPLIDRVIAGKGGDRFLTALLMQVGCIIRFCRYLAHGERPARLDGLEARLTRGLTDAAERAAWNAGKDAAARRRAEVLTGVLVGLDMHAAAVTLLSLPPTEE